jgi:hypothetical protein
MHCDEDLYEFETHEADVQPKSFELLHLILLTHDLMFSDKEEKEWL